MQTDFKTILRKGRNKTNVGCVYFLIKDCWISTGIRLHPDFWNDESCTISTDHPQYFSINPIFCTYQARALQFLTNTALDRETFSLNGFKEFVFASTDYKNPMIKKLYLEYCTENNISLQRAKHYKYLLEDLNAIKPNCRLQDLDYKFAIKLKSYLKKKGNNENTISRKLKQIKALVHYAKKTGLIKTDPLAMVKISAIKGKKKFLTKAELLHLEELHQSDKLNFGQKTVLTYFLFSCYTGLRYSDIVKLKADQIKENIICLKQQKTGVEVEVPLISKAIALLKYKAGKCFETYQNQPTNRILKEIMIIAKINKDISFHCSRHTFATISISVGVPVEVVAELLGVNMATVRIYAKIITDVKSHYLANWEKMTA